MVFVLLIVKLFIFCGYFMFILFVFLLVFFWLFHVYKVQFEVIEFEGDVLVI